MEIIIATILASIISLASMALCLVTLGAVANKSKRVQELEIANVVREKEISQLASQISRTSEQLVGVIHLVDALAKGKANTKDLGEHVAAQLREYFKQEGN